MSIIRFILLVFVTIPIIFSAESQVDFVKKDLLQRFDKLLESPDDYAKIVRKECLSFPEGDLFPLTFPAMAYCKIKSENAEQYALTLLRLSKKVVEKRIGCKIERLKSYRQHSTYLGQYNLALSIYNSTYKNEELSQLNKIISSVLVEGFKNVRYQQIRSFPKYTWTFDSIPALLSIKLDKHTAKDLKSLTIKKHLDWIRSKATEKSSGLPYSQFGEITAAPRGCELSLRIPMIHQLDEDYAAELYANYCKAFWQESGVFSGFKEWQSIKARGDIDSGPIILGLGTSATAMSLPCLQIFNDEKKLFVYNNYLSIAPMVKAMIKKNNDSLGIDLGDTYYTGLLFGDCVLFYVVNWNN